MDEKEIKKVENIFNYAFENLCENDKELLQDRTLHEECINHRLAYYIEKYLEFYDEKYNVDMEFNRNGKEEKVLPGNSKNKSGRIRPDIIVHTRMKELENKYKNYIVIEAKRDKDSEKDKDIVTRFIEVEEYEYKVGVTINYNKFNPIKATLYYKNSNDEIKQKYLEYPDMQAKI
ncbi:hypothetical protein [Intestinibacter bartlettii]|uniref:hypothetical protein n=1 Tax=Intestinibacter bartlettii TaxID=261299 RepID=UPI003218FFB6